MLSSVTLNCQVTMIVIDTGSKNGAMQVPKKPDKKAPATFKIFLTIHASGIDAFFSQHLENCPLKMYLTDLDSKEPNSGYYLKYFSL